MTRIPMTTTGAASLREELQVLKTKTRQEIVAAIAEARAHGDLKENAEYHAARERQSFVEGRIQEIESKLSHAHVIDVSKMENADGRVIFGATVHVVNVETDVETRFTIVGEDEADLKKGKISVTSPTARALIGKFEGDPVEVTTPGGLIEYEILKVEYV